MRIRIRAAGALLAAALPGGVLLADVPFWGAREPEPVGTDPEKPKPGQFLLKVLAPGATLYVTDSPVLPQTTGPSLNVVNSDPPAAKS